MWSWKGRTHLDKIRPATSAGTHSQGQLLIPRAVAAGAVS